MEKKACWPVVMALLGLMTSSSPCWAADIASFVMRSYDSGIPCSEAKAFSPQDVSVLDHMLMDPQFEPYWANIVATLGCVGDPAAVPSLKNFIDSHSGEVSFETYSAMLEVPTALGFISFNGDEQALTVLTSLAEDEHWRSIKLRMNNGVIFEQASLQKNLMRSTIGALGYSGQPKALNVLEQMRRNPSYQQEFRDDIKFAITQ